MGSLAGLTVRVPTLFPQSLATITETRAWRILLRIRSSRFAVVFVSTLAIFTDALTCGIIVPAMPDLLQDKLGLSSSANGVLFGMFGLGIIVGAIVSSIISDRFNIRRSPMIFGLIGLGVSSGLFAVSSAFWQLVLARIAQGISSGVSWAIGLSMVADVYPGDKIGQPMGIVFMGYTLGYLGGPIFGGFLYEYGGMHAIAIFIACFVFVDLIFRLLLVEPSTIRARQSLHDTLHNSRQQDSAWILGNGTAGVDNEDEEDGGEGGTSTTSISITASAVEARSTSDGPDKAAIAAVVDASNAQRGELGLVARPNTAAPTTTITASVAMGTSLATAQSNGAVERTTSGYNKKEHRQDIAGSSDVRSRSSYLTIWKLLLHMEILVCCLATLFHAGCTGAIEPTLPVNLADKYGLSSGQIGAMMVAFAVPSALFGPVFGWLSDNPRVLRRLQPFGRLGLIGIFTLLTAICLAMLALPENIPSVAVVLVFIGICTDGAVVPVMSAMGAFVHHKGWDCYAQLYALFNIAYSVAVIITPSISGVVLHAAGFKWTCAFLGLLLFFGLFVIMVPPLVKYCILKRPPPFGSTATTDASSNHASNDDSDHGGDVRTTTAENCSIDYP